MEITQNQTNSAETSEINHLLAESGIIEKATLAKKRFSFPYFSPRPLLVSFLALLFLLVLGLTVVVAVKNTLKKAFEPSLSETLSQEEQTQQPTLTPEKPATSPAPQTQISRGRLPQSCYENPESEECKNKLQEILDKECGGDPEAAACEPYFQEAVALQAAQECLKDPNSLMCRCLREKDPGECIGQEIRAQIFVPIFCTLAQIPFMAGAFDKLCSESGLPSVSRPSVPESQVDCQLNPYAPECQEHFQSTCSQDPYAAGCEEYAETVCLDDPNAAGCEDYCLQNPESQVCQQRCQVDINIPGCQEFLQNYCQFYPYQPGCDQYFELTCAQDPYQAGCIEHCWQNPYTDGCVAFLLQYCRGNLSDPLCMQVLCDRAPQLCTLCQQFPNLCAQIRW